MLIYCRLIVDSSALACVQTCVLTCVSEPCADVCAGHRAGLSVWHRLWKARGTVGRLGLPCLDAAKQRHLGFGPGERHNNVPITDSGTTDVTMHAINCDQFQ